MLKLIRVAADRNQTKANIIFIHGLSGDAYNTWQHSSNPRYFWPTWLAEDIEGLDISTLSYASPALNWQGYSLSLRDRSISVLNLLLNNEHVNSEKIVFVCHSLGGLIVKQVLREAIERSHQHKEYELLVKKIKGVVFYSTPHGGSHYASIASKLRYFFHPSPSTTDMVSNREELRSLNQWYQNQDEVNSIKHQIYYETHDLGAGLVVNETSANVGLKNVFPIPLDGDHITVCKPTDKDDQRYFQTKNFVQKLVGDPASNRSEHENQFFPIQSTNQPKTISFYILNAMRLVSLLILMYLFYLLYQGLTRPSDDPLRTKLIVDKILATESTTSQNSDEIRLLRKLLESAIDGLGNQDNDLASSKKYKKITDNINLGQTEAAEELYLEIALKEKNDAKSSSKNIANAYRNAGALAYNRDPGRALSHFRNAVELDDEDISSQLMLGHLYHRLGYPKQAKATYENVLEIANKMTETKQKYLNIANAQCGLGTYYFVERDALRSIEHIEAAVKIYKDNNQEIDTYIGCFTNSGYMYSLIGNYARANEVNSTYLSWAEQIEDNVHISRALRNLALANMNIDQSEKSVKESIKLLNKSIEIAEDTISPDELAHAYGNIGSAYLALNDIPNSKKNFLLALNLSQKESLNRGNEAWNYLQIGKIALAEAKIDDAKRNFEICMEIYATIDRPEGLALCKSALAKIYTKQGEFEQGEILYVDAIAINKKIAITDRLANDYFQYGNLLSQWKKPEKAIQQYQNALTQYKIQNRGDQIAKLNYSIGNRHYDIKQYELAISFYSRAINYFSEHSLNAELANIYYFIGYSYLGLGDNKQAKISLNKALPLITEHHPDLVTGLQESLVQLE